MERKIGQVTIDETWYPGEDLYSDGAVEEELLALSGDYSREEYNRIIAQKKSWPVLYHYSHVRENIVRWIPFTGKEKVLEIGSGCGAITGALCDLAGEVTCIDLSRRRSEVNARRHAGKDNLKIIVGNFQDIEPNLTELYDYVTLIGVFEYGEGYIQSEKPYVDFLKTILKHLKPDGKIIIAIENRFGLKYWAGCTEDHFGTLFEGLEGYLHSSGVKTFTKKEWTALLKEAGDLHAQFYYPFPDYKFPMTIYSDARLPHKGELNRTEYNFDRLRLDLFQDSAVYDSILENDLYPEFANSFLLLVGRQEAELPAAYVKFSNERDPLFHIRTEIERGTEFNRTEIERRAEFNRTEADQGTRPCGGCRNDAWAVRKVPEGQESREHVQALCRHAADLKERYAKAGWQINACTPDGDGVRLEYVEGITLEEKLDALLEEKKLEELERLLFTFLENIRKVHQEQKFIRTPAFEHVFGKSVLPDGLWCGSVSNIDLVAGNFVLEKGRITVIDYEWTFDFPVPANYILYRMIHYYVESDAKRLILRDRNFYEKLGISREEQRQYGEMERHFQQYMLGSHVPMPSLYEEISPGRVSAKAYYEQCRLHRNKEALQIFRDTGDGFLEEESERIPMDPEGICLHIPVKEGTCRLRLDPGDVSGGCRVDKLAWEDGTGAGFITNGYFLGNGEYYFVMDDPQIVIETIPEGARTLVMELKPLPEEECRRKFQDCLTGRERRMQEEICGLRQELELKKRQIHEMENTKVWKAYRAVKRQK